LVKSKYQFDRWNAQPKQTWAYSMFLKYDFELTRISAAHYTAKKFIYSGLKSAGATLNDAPEEKFGFINDEVGRYQYIKEWSDLYNEFDNWTNLNSLLTLASNLETYLAASVRLAITSNPGVLLGLSKSIDGAILLKNQDKPLNASHEIVEACTRGDWGSRLKVFSRTFGTLPSFASAHADLEFIRKVWNEVGHSFGRDIEQAQEHGQVNKVPIRKLNHERFRNLQKIIWSVVRDIDGFLLHNHIGEFEVIDFYNKQPHEHRQMEIRRRTMLLKKAVGRYGAVPRGKTFCSGLIEYWDEL
jgi:hypothetical protein